MNQFLPQTRRDAKKDSPANDANPRESLVGLDRRADPRLRRERAARECQKNKVEFAVASGEPDKQDSYQQAANSEPK